MKLDPQQFTVYDITDFPIVTVRNGAIVPGYAAQWEAELNALVAQPQPFPAGRPEEENHEDRKRRWVGSRPTSSAWQVCAED